MSRIQNETTALTLTIYKIDPSKAEMVMGGIGLQEDFSLGRIPEIIYLYYTDRRNRGLSTNKEYLLTNIQNSIIWDTGYFISIYKTQDSPDFTPPIATYFPDHTIDDLLWKIPPSLAIFIYNDEHCYAIGNWKWYIFFENFVDIGFPIELAKRIMDPKVSNTTERDITWAIYARVQQFRNDQLIESQSIGTVWNAINWFISQSVYNSAEFQNIFTPERSKITVNVGAWVTIKRSIPSSKLLDFFGWAEWLLMLPLTPEQEIAFHQLDGLSEINIRKNRMLFSSLELEVASVIKDQIDNLQKIDFDFCHRDFQSYQSSESYWYNSPISSAIPDWQNQKTCHDIIMELYRNGFLDINSKEDLLASLKNIHITANHPLPTNSVYWSILDHIHWEVRYDNYTFFRIDGRWFKIENSFEEELSEKFENILNNPA